MGIKIDVVGCEEFPSCHLDECCHTPAVTVATIVVGAKFDVDSDIILGRDRYGVSVQRKGYVNGQTVLFVSANTYGSDEAARRLTINAVVERLQRFLDNPAQAYEMSQENPFPEPEER